MWQKTKNRFSYIKFAFMVDWRLLVSTFFDIIALFWSIIHIKTIFNEPNLLLIIIAVIISIVFQFISVINHFSFLKFKNQTGSLESMLQTNRVNSPFSVIKVDDELTTNHHYTVDYNIGVLRNEEIDKILQNNNIRIIPILGSVKSNNTKEYVLQYKDTLLQFLNQKWYEVNPKNGIMTNDKKICLSNEITRDDNHYEWTINEGCYYFGYLTNFIFTKKIGGSDYPIYPPKNCNNYSITTLGLSHFSDHIGVSTLLYTSDNYVIVFQQSNNSVGNPGKYMPSGSGSLNYSDYNKNDHDIRDIIIRGVNRELLEETSLKKKKSIINVKTEVLRYYRNMERGGKPEFCCISRVFNREKGVYILQREELTTLISPSKQELSNGTIKCVSVYDKTEWENNILPNASISLKMNYEAIMAWIESQ